MRAPRILFLLMLCGLLGLGTALAKEPSGYAKPPWHLADIWWQLPEITAPFQRLSIDVEIATPLRRPVKLYLAPIGWGEFNGQGFYGGLQTQAEGYDAKGVHHFIGPGLLFSRWDERSPQAMRPVADGVSESAGYEGDFISVRRPYNWGPGKYTLSLVALPPERQAGKAYTWVEMRVKSLKSKAETPIGALRFSGETLKLASSFASFVEIYGEPIPLSEIPDFKVSFGNLRVNNRIAPVSAQARYHQDVPPYLHAYSPKPGTISFTLGKPISREGLAWSDGHYEEKLF